MSQNEETNELLRQILKWVRFSGLENARNELRRALDTDQKRVIYNLSDGEKGSQEISKLSGLSDFTVRAYWKEWSKRGLVDPINVRGGTRYKSSFDLEEFGLLVPAIELGKSDEDE
ncbi:hypothetical protein KQH27_00850 [bacterium]|nr:hypothetical protein [bacterium]